MSIPPPYPNSPFSPPPPKPPQSRLAKLAIIFAVTAGVTFGLCTVTVFGTHKFGEYIFVTSLVIEAICILGLLGIVVAVIINSIRGK